MKLKQGDYVNAALTSKHANCTGTLVNADGNFLTVLENPAKPNPLSYKTALTSQGRVFQLDSRLAIKLKELPCE